MAPDTAIPEGFSRLLAARLAALRYEDLPPELVARVKLFVLDTLGVIGGAAKAPGIAALNGLLGRWAGRGKARSLLGGWQGAPDTAALANATAAHALDFDDQHDDARVHTYCVVLPAALAAAEEQGGIDGRRFITALVAGVELHTRLGLACPNSIGKGWHPTTALGHFAASAAAARVLGLDADGMQAALGIGYAQLAGSAQGLYEQAMTKRFGPGFAARSGTLAAFLAAEGVNGPTQFMEGRAGFARLYERGEVKPGILTDRWGEEWQAMAVSMKPYPCCRCCHSTIQLALALRERGVRPEQVAGGTIYLGEVNRSVVSGRYDPSTARNPVVHAQFNATYTFAHALSHGRADLESFREPAISDPAVVALARRLDVARAEGVADTSLPYAAYTLRLADGTTLSQERLVVKGSPEEPMTEAEAVAKFQQGLSIGMGVPEQAAAQYAEAIMALERMPDVSTLAGGFRALPTALPGAAE